MLLKFRLLYTYFCAKFRCFYSRKCVDLNQKRKFESFKRNTLINSPFYYPFVISDIPLNQYPLANKEKMMGGFDLYNTAGLFKKDCFDIALKAENDRNFSPTLGKHTIGLSSGTSGNRGLFVASDKERMIWAGNMLAKMLPKSIFRTQSIAFFLRANSNLYTAVKSKKIQFSFYDLLEDFDNLIAGLSAQNPDILIAPAQVLVMIAKKMANKEIDISPIKIISVAEVLTHEDKNFIERIFNKRVDIVYQCTEGFLGHTCSHGTIHLNEDLVIIEKQWIDEEETRFSPIITDFTRETQPIIRYLLDDVLVVKEKPCGCGSHFLAIESIEGRCDDVLTFKNDKGVPTPIFPDFIRNAIIKNTSDACDYRATQEKENLLLLSLSDDASFVQYELARRGIVKLLASKGITTVDIEMGVFKEHVITEKLRRIKKNFK